MVCSSDGRSHLALHELMAKGRCPATGWRSLHYTHDHATQVPGLQSFCPEHIFKAEARCQADSLLLCRDMSGCKLQSQRRVLSFKIVTLLHQFTAYYNPGQADHRLSITFDALDEAAAVFQTLPHV